MGLICQHSDRGVRQDLPRRHGPGHDPVHGAAAVGNALGVAVVATILSMLRPATGLATATARGPRPVGAPLGVVVCALLFVPGVYGVEDHRRRRGRDPGVGHDSGVRRRTSASWLTETASVPERSYIEPRTAPAPRRSTPARGRRGSTRPGTAAGGTTWRGRGWRPSSSRGRAPRPGPRRTPRPCRRRRWRRTPAAADRPGDGRGCGSRRGGSRSTPPRIRRPSAAPRLERRVVIEVGEDGPVPLGVGIVGVGDAIRDGRGVLGPALVLVERARQVEDRLAALHRHHPSGGERPPLADAVDVEDQRCRR